MATTTWTYRYHINAPVNQIYRHLSDPQSYIGLSPLVVRVYDVVKESSGIHYTSVERFTLLGIMPYDNHIRVHTRFTQPNQEMVSDVVSPFAVKVRFVFHFEAEADGTGLTETVTAQMPALLQGFVVGQAKSVQQARAQILKSRLEDAAVYHAP
jgi:ligand-binding SRPBCC domain-containing protein